MKSLKRTLCLVLALVMVLGLFGIASATDFTDDDTIQYKEAVDVVTGIGAINGMGDGTFNPKGNTTRAQAAKLVTYVALSKDVADNLTGVSSSFTDVTVDGGFAWAIPSIEYLVKEGVINGMGDGTFNPNGEISGYAVLKLLLCSLGYGAKEEYVGNGWDLQVAIDANKTGLTAGRASNAAALSAPATREEIALYCFNALGAEVVAYNRLLDRYEKSTTTSTYDSNKQLTLADDVYGIQAVVEGVITKNGAIDADAAKDGITTVDSTDYQIATGLDLIGHYVKVYFKAAVGTDDPVAYAIVDASTVVNVAKAITTEDEWKAAFGSTDIANAAASSTVQVSNAYAVSTGAFGGTLNSAADPGTYILNKKEIVAVIAPAAYTVAPVAAYTAPTATAAGSITLGVTEIALPKIGDPTTVNLYADPAVQDIAILQTTGAFKTITKAVVIGSGKISSVDTAKGTLVASGTTYEKSANFINDSFVDASSGKLAKWNASLVNTTCAFLADAAGKVVAVAPIDGSSDAGLVYIVKAYQEAAASSYGTKVYLNKVQCVDMTGKEVIYVIGAASSESVSAKDLAGAAVNEVTPKSLVTVSIAYNDTLKADMATLTDVSDAGSAVYGTGTASGDKPATDKKIAANHYYDASTQFIFVTGNGATLKVTTLTGPQTIPDTANYVYAATKVAGDDTNATVNYVVVDTNPKAAAANGIMFIPLDAAFSNKVAVSYTQADGRDGTAYQNIAFVDGTPNTAVITLQSEIDKIDADATFCTYSVDSATGLYTLTKINPDENTNVGNGAVTNVYGNLLTTTGGKNALTDVNASGATIVDVPYLNAMLTNATLPEQHTTLASLKGGLVAYTTVTANSEKSVTVIYYLGAAPSAPTVAEAPGIVSFSVGGQSGTIAADATSGTATVAEAKIGDTLTLTATAAGDGWTSTGGTATVTGTAGQAGSATISFSFTADGKQAKSYSVTVTITEVKAAD